MNKNNSKKILIVEDDLSNHPLFRKAFENSGFQVVISQNADGEFASDVSEVAPDIISMDLMIGKPDVVLLRDGFDAIELLKGDERTKHIPIIVMTNFFEISKVERAKALGAADYVSLQGNSITEIPDIFTAYLKDPKHYNPTHPVFRD